MSARQTLKHVSLNEREKKKNDAQKDPDFRNLHLATATEKLKILSPVTVIDISSLIFFFFLSGAATKYYKLITE